ncbi:hypothetical protein F4801DRAFT_556985 [Xylaria longipes]|nr:hypothetical protein F4801DRAFT_556985 [Xylaria longipes]
MPINMRLAYLQARPPCARLRCYFGNLSNMHNSALQAWKFSRFSNPNRRMASVTKLMPSSIPQLVAADLDHASQQHHVDNVYERLQQDGILKISLGFADPDSQYLKQLVLSLHQQHDHQLPISHSASRGWFWDVRPSKASFQTANHQARSETMEKFPWHTDCSYEDLPPRYFALHVLQHDRRGGGTLSILNVQRLCESLSLSTRTSLMRQEYSIKIPLEFIKDTMQQRIVGSLMAIDQDGQPSMMRFRRDILTPLTEKASSALRELDISLEQARTQSQSTVHLTSSDIPAGSIILMDNRRWLHARNNINDPQRHLRRVRWDAVPFPCAHKE